MLGLFPPTIQTVLITRTEHPEDQVCSYYNLTSPCYLFCHHLTKSNHLGIGYLGIGYRP